MPYYPAIRNFLCIHHYCAECLAARLNLPTTRSVTQPSVRGSTVAEAFGKLGSPASIFANSLLSHVPMATSATPHASNTSGSGTETV